MVFTMFIVTMVLLCVDCESTINILSVEYNFLISTSTAVDHTQYIVDSVDRMHQTHYMLMISMATSSYKMKLTMNTQLIR